MSNMNLKNIQTQWIIAEFQEIRKEITRRSNEQFICITGSIVALGSTLVFISKNPSTYYPLLIIVPWILTIFGFIWNDHSQHIFFLGSYIREKIEKQINELIIYKEKMGWQHYIHEIRLDLEKEAKKPSFIVWSLPLIFFILPSITCILAYIVMRFGEIVKLPVPIEILLFVMGVFFIIMLSISWLRAIKSIVK